MKYQVIVESEYEHEPASINDFETLDEVVEYIRENKPKPDYVTVARAYYFPVEAIFKLAE